MTRVRPPIGAVFPAAVFIAAIALSGCTHGFIGVGATYTHTRPYDQYERVYVSAPPPPTVVEYRSVQPGPGYFWIDGYWDWTGYDWYWIAGSWYASRPGYFYVRPSYVSSGGRWVYQRGYWNGSGGRREYHTAPPARGWRSGAPAAPAPSAGSWQRGQPAPPAGAYGRPAPAAPTPGAYGGPSAPKIGRASCRERV